MDPTVIAGTVTLGMVASFVAQGLKFFGLLPKSRALTRGLVVVLCVGLNVALSYATGTLDLSALPETIVSYLTAVTAYDHLFA